MQGFGDVQGSLLQGAAGKVSPASFLQGAGVGGKSPWDPSCKEPGGPPPARESLASLLQEAGVPGGPLLQGFGGPLLQGAGMQWAPQPGPGDATLPSVPVRTHCRKSRSMSRSCRRENSRNSPAGLKTRRPPPPGEPSFPTRPSGLPGPGPGSGARPRRPASSSAAAAMLPGWPLRPAPPRRRGRPRGRAAAPLPGMLLAWGDPGCSPALCPPSPGGVRLPPLRIILALCPHHRFCGGPGRIQAWDRSGMQLRVVKIKGGDGASAAPGAPTDTCAPSSSIHQDRGFGKGEISMIIIES